MRDAFYFRSSSGERKRRGDSVTRSPVGDVFASTSSTAASTATHARRVNEINVYILLYLVLYDIYNIVIRINVLYICIEVHELAILYYFTFSCKNYCFKTINILRKFREKYIFLKLGCTLGYYILYCTGTTIYKL